MQACLGPKVKENERNIVEVTSFDHKQDKVSACVCSLKINSNEDVSLGDLTIFPPAIFKLIEGQLFVLWNWPNASLSRTLLNDFFLC